MTAMNFDHFDKMTATQASASPPSLIDIQDTYWGYIIKSAEGQSAVAILGATITWLFGLSFAVASLGLWIVPNAVQDPSLFSFKLGLSVILAGIAAFCLWYASRGTDVELQIDTRKGEIRETVRNRAGRATVLACYGFDSINEAILDHKFGNKGEAGLILTRRNQATPIFLACDVTPRIEALRARIVRDLILDQGLTNREPVQAPMPLDFAAA